MAEHAKPKIQNDKGVTTIRDGVKEFECIGASQPL